MLLKSLSGMLLIWGLQACGNRAWTPPPRSLVDGLWESSCVVSPEGEGYQVHLKFYEGRWVARREIHFRDANCATALTADAFDGRYELSLAPEDHLYKIDIIFEKLSALALNAEGEARLRSTQYCGRNDWQVGVQRDIARLQAPGCRSFGVLPIANWNLIEIYPGRSLRFAEELQNDNTRPLRVASEDPSLIFRKPAGDKEIVP